MSPCNKCTANEFTNLSLTVYRSGGIIFLQMDKRLYSRRIHYKTDAYGSYIANCLFLLECLGTAWQTGNVIIRNEGFERQRRMTAPFLPSFSQTRCLQWRLIEPYFHSRHVGFERRQEMEPEVDKGLGMAFRVTFLLSVAQNRSKLGRWFSYRL